MNHPDEKTIAAIKSLTGDERFEKFVDYLNLEFERAKESLTFCEASDVQELQGRAKLLKYLVGLCTGETLT